MAMHPEEAGPADFARTLALERQKYAAHPKPSVRSRRTETSGSISTVSQPREWPTLRR